MHMRETLISVNNLVKDFKGLRAVNGLSFTVPQGEVYGFLGQNGAGKSTTIRMLLTLVQPTSGSIQLFGQNLTTERHTILRQVGAVIERPDLYKYLTAYDNLRIMARLSGVKVGQKELMRELERVGLGQRAHSRVKTFSQGMKQRLGIACALIHNPQLIILDEPTNGLDPQGIADIRNLILHLVKNEGKSVFVSSHLLSEIQLIADSMLIIDKGREVAQGRVSELLNPSETIVQLHTTDDAATTQWLQASQWQQHLAPAADGIQLRLHSNRIPLLNRDLVGAGVDVLSLQSRHSLEDYFLSLTTSNQHVAAYQH
ncbi:ABC-2 type transport system ATP-binding protein [Cnuella takakiae]|uniref:ABC-2 type transport system ATP-binding protein n=2 Tax=Cnuella takakiae TaxID=1302690 RepID=A0A1M5I359_9BACT|nr:ABC-2 type transport system ATP-binding protein [Cnuella takakiae]